MKTKLYFLLLLGLGAACNRHSKKPRLYLHNPLVIMDTVHMDTTYTIWFVLMNKGEAPLEIELMRTLKRAFDPLNLMNPGKVI